jgi:hypothetical protein
VSLSLSRVFGTGVGSMRGIDGEAESRMLVVNVCTCQGTETLHDR